MPPSAASLLNELERIHRDYGDGSAPRKLDLVRKLERARLPSARQVLRLHEILCFLRAYPDDAALLSAVLSALEKFETRADLRRVRADLEDTGVAGTAIHFPFHWVTACWLVEHFPHQLHVDWERVGEREVERFEQVLPLLLPYAEWPDFSQPLDTKQWLERLKGPRETDAAFLVRRFLALDANARVRESLFHDLAMPMKLSPGAGTPARTHAAIPVRRISYQTKPLSRSRPDLRRLPTPKRVVDVSPRRARLIIDQAREAMLTRGRDLDGIMYADPRDVRLVDAGDGLSLACLGLLPEQRALVETIYVFLLLENGVPIGYFQSALLFKSAEVNYHVFPSFRGAEAAEIYARSLGVVQHMFGVDAFSVHPYQLGHENPDALAAGAFWFYAKFGFRPEAPERMRLFERELTALRRRPGHRSSTKVLQRLVPDYVYFYTGKRRENVAGKVDLGRIQLAVSDHLALHYGAERERGLDECAERVGHLLGLGRRRLNPDEWEALRRWAPLVLSLPSLGRFGARDRRELAALILAKGGRREGDFARRLDAHPKLCAALLALARGRKNAS
ncbi:MAG: hypothetical protein R3B13_12255 [Polyangiaceae bacterium]